MDMRIGPTPHLSWKELACKDGTPFPVEWKRTRAIQLAGVFEYIRERCGKKPITVLSAYRTVARNAAIGGAKNSYHLHGLAMDLKPPAGMTVDEFYNIIKKDARPLGIGGLGKYKTFVHIDMRTGTRLLEWLG
jgi:uncharacterized protein YcbK (DUF882 family)